MNRTQQKLEYQSAIYSSIEMSHVSDLGSSITFVSFYFFALFSVHLIYLN